MALERRLVGGGQLDGGGGGRSEWFGDDLWVEREVAMARVEGVVKDGRTGRNG